MSGKRIAIVTGASNGIGVEIALGTARAGLHTVLACRNRAKAESVMEDMTTRVPDGSFEVLVVDLGDFESVRTAAAEYREKHDRLDVLINNAGVLDYSGRKASNGYELQLMTNHLGHMLFTSLLLDLMPDESASRIVSMSSVAHKGAKIYFDDIHCERATANDAAYGQSKLACLLFGDELDRRLRSAGKNVRSLTAHPGGSDSGLFHDMNRIQYALLKLVSPIITHSQESAAQPALVAALSESAEGGSYYGPTGLLELKGPAGIAKRDPITKDATVASHFWEVSEELIGEPFRLT